MSTSKQPSINDNDMGQVELNDEVNLSLLLDSIIRNRKVIAGYTIAGLLVGFLYSISAKKIWEGEFQIVLENRTSEQNIIRPELARLAGIREANNSKLKTEVGILKSPSVLLSVFNFVKQEKPKKSSSLKFKPWLKSQLKVELEDGTSILNISYQDTKKEIILPVLNKLSSSYQVYSGSKRLRGIQLGVNYFKEQIELYKNKSFDSIKKAQQFAIDQDLSILGGETELDKEIPNVINIERTRIEAANKIRLIDQQLLQIKDLNYTPEQIMFTASTIPALSNLSNQLKKLDTNLSRIKIIYKDNDKVVQDLRKERLFIIDLLKRQVKGFLIAQKEDAQARLIAAERPEGVLINYKRLLDNAARDKSTLSQLENQYRTLLLEKARNEDPWEIITTPTLIEDPVFPNIKKISAIGSILGFILGLGMTFISDNRKKIIYSTNEMEKLTEWPLLSELSVADKSSFDENLNLLKTGPLSNIKENICLYSVGGIKKSTIDKISKYLNQIETKLKIIVTEDLIEAANYSNIIILTALGSIKEKEIIDLKKKLVQQRNTILGLIVLTKSD